MPIWKTATVTDQPELTLVHWRILEASTGDLHFLGACVELGGGRFSTAIEKFDPAQMRGVTRSGRVYQLLGETGCDLDADYVLSCVLAAWDNFSVRDVTAQALMAANK